MIYLDHAATTPLAPEVREAMLPYLGERFGNASALYGLGRQSRAAIESAREVAAAFLGCRPQEILFTSGGSESDNLALRGVLMARRGGNAHLITTAIEHHAVLNTARFLQGQGFPVTVLPPSPRGSVSAAEVEEAITSETALISVMHGNNEVGTLLPIREIGALARARGILFHVDAVQTAGCLPLRVREIPCDLLTVSAHKLHGPKGVGLLYRRIGVPLATQITGGDQEFGQRAGTENVAGIAGIGAALELAWNAMESGAVERMQALRDRLIAGVLQTVPWARLTGCPQQRLPHHASFLFPGIEGESLLLNLDRHGICASSGAACATGEIEPSHVLLAMGVETREAQGALRLTLGRETTAAEIDRVLEVLPPLVESLRRLRTPAPSGKVTAP